MRQVSPAPAIATFNDVPANDPAFQFIEALAASGITVGCSESPPLYCPDSCADSTPDGGVSVEGPRALLA